MCVRRDRREGCFEGNGTWLQLRKKNFHELGNPMSSSLLVNPVYMRFDSSWMNAKVFGDGFCRVTLHQFHENFMLASRQGGQEVVAKLCCSHARLIYNAQTYSDFIYFQSRTDL